jgi:succinoglycan biosynthesis transport protein ExoP
MLPSDPNRPEPSRMPAVPGVEALGMASEIDNLVEPSLPAATNIIDFPTETSSAMPDTSAILSALRRRWLPALLLGVSLAAIGGLGMRLVLPVKFTAEVRFHIASRAPSIVFQSDAGGDFANYQRTQVELIKSQLVLDPVLKKPEVAALPVVRQQLDPIQWIEDQLLCEFSAPEILRLRLTGRDPGETETLLAAISEAYLREVGNKERYERGELLQQLSRVRDKWERDLAQKRKNFRERAEEAGSSDAQTLAHSQRLANEAVAAARAQLIAFQSDLRQAEVQLRIREQQSDKTVAPATVLESEIEEQMRRDKDLFELGTRQRELEMKLKTLRMSSVIGEDHATVKEVRNELQTIGEAIAVKKRELRPGILKQLSAGGAPNSISGARDHIAFLKEMEKRLVEDIERYSKETRTINHSSLHLDALREEIAQCSKMTEAVASRAEALKVELDAPARVTILEKPKVSYSVNGRKQMLATAGAAFGGLALAFVGVVGWELRARRILDPAQLSSALRIRILGTLPVLAASRRAHMLETRSTDKYPSDLLTESVDRARLKLLFAGREHPLKVVLITSATSGEGKTSLASHLAVSLARAGRRTLVIDADLRRPSLHRLFDVLLEPGLAAVLRGELAVADAIRPTVVHGLELIPAGRGDVNAIQALGQERVRSLFEQLKEAYDYVLVDSAPVMPVIDASIIAQYVDGVLFSVMCGVSHLPSLHHSYRELAQLGVRILGVVVSGARLPTGSYGYPPIDLNNE